MMEALRDRFRSACGAAGPIRLDVREVGRAEVDSHSICAPYAVVGRSSAADLVLDRPSVSRRHAYLQIIDGRLFFAALGPAEVLQGGRPARSGWLVPGEPIRLGRLQLDVRADPPGKSPAMLGVADALAALGDPRGLPDVVLRFPRRGGGELSWRMNRLLTLVGRDPICRIRLAGEVSSVHCALLRTADGLWSVDLLGRGGVAVHGRQARLARLATGDVVEIGRYRIHVDSGPSGLGEMGGLPVLMGGLGPPLVPDVHPASVEATPAWFDRDSGTTPSFGRTLLSQMTGQFALMQQQMFAQFQQSLLAMAQMFGTLQREQVEAIRGEIDRIRQLNQEMVSLQAELMAQREDAGATASEPAPSPTASEPGPHDSRPGQASGPAIHFALDRRIAALQEEGQGLWQKLMDRVLSRDAKP